MIMIIIIILTNRSRASYMKHGGTRYTMPKRRTGILFIQPTHSGIFEAAGLNSHGLH